jgi:hypothetical protein
VQLAVQMKLLDAEVMALSRLLAVRTLQLEMEFIYRCAGGAGHKRGIRLCAALA